MLWSSNAFELEHYNGLDMLSNALGHEPHYDLGMGAMVIECD